MTASIRTGSLIGLGAAGIGTLFAVGVLGSCIFSVKPYERAVVTRGGAFEYVANPGLHMLTPFIGGEVSYRVDTQGLRTDKMNTLTVDNQEVDAIVDLRYDIPVDQVAYIYREQRGYESSLRTLVANEWKNAAGTVNCIDFAKNRAVLEHQVFEAVREKAKALYHINITYLGLTEVDYAPSFRQAQASAALVKARIEQSLGEKTKATIEAETAKIVASGQANMVIEQARGQAESTKLNADADAYAVAQKGAAQAKAQELMAEALAKNASLVDYTKAQRWNGQLPSAIYAGAPIPFLNAPVGR